MLPPCRAASVRNAARPRIERELEWTQEVLHNIEGCILQLEGKLLTAAAPRPHA